MKRYIQSSKLTEFFLKYHEDMDNYSKNRDGFEKAYEILDKYGTENEPVDVVFDRATPEDQKKILDFISPSNIDGSHEMLISAVSGDTKETSYGQGVLDTFRQLVQDGYLKEETWNDIVAWN